MDYPSSPKTAHLDKNSQPLANYRKNGSKISFLGFFCKMLVETLRFLAHSPSRLENIGASLQEVNQSKMDAVK